MNKTNILIMTDEPVVLEMLKTILDNEGFNTLLASNGEQALKTVEDEDVDLFLADIMIPKRHGIAISWEMRTKGYTFPIIIMSAFLDQWDKEVFKDCKINRWLSKPVKQKVLINVIRELLEEEGQ